MLLATALALLMQDVLSNLYSIKPATVAPKTITHHSLILQVVEKKSCRCSQNFGGAENVVKTETQQTFVNGLLGFAYFRHLYSAGSVIV